MITNNSDIVIPGRTTRYNHSRAYKEAFDQLKVGNQVDKFYSGMCIPSAVHGYGLAVEYYRDWFLNKMKNDIKFKTVFINGRHILQDYMRYSELSLVKQEKPAVAITPMANFEHDREEQDKYMGSKNLMIGKFNHEQCFFKDHYNNIFIGLGTRDLEVEFNVRCRVETRAQQMDLYRIMELNCRVGWTEYEYISADFHIPSSIIKNVAVVAGFELDENEEVKDPINFVKYLNMHSEMPILYKLRTITGKSEYFVRPNRVYTHIATKDKLQRDDGEREGQLMNNFNIDMNSTLNMWVPSYYVLFSAKPVYKYMPILEDSAFGLYTVEITEIPDVNEQGWNLYIKTNWEMSLERYKEKECEIDISSLTYNTQIRRAIQYHIDMGLSPKRFIDVKIFDYDHQMKYAIDWSTLKVHCCNFKSKSLAIAIYIDTEYYNQFIETTDNLSRTRYGKGSEA